MGRLSYDRHATMLCHSERKNRFARMPEYVAGMLQGATAESMCSLVLSDVSTLPAGNMISGKLPDRVIKPATTTLPLVTAVSCGVLLTRTVIQQGNLPRQENNITRRASSTELELSTARSIDKVVSKASADDVLNTTFDKRICGKWLKVGVAPLRRFAVGCVLLVPSSRHTVTAAAS